MPLEWTIGGKQYPTQKNRNTEKLELRKKIK